jgi:hypothetical protein
MGYSTIGPGQEISAEGVVYDKGSVKEGAIRPLVRLNSGSPVSHANKPLPCGCWKFAGLIGVSKPVLIIVETLPYAKMLLVCGSAVAQKSWPTSIISSSP